MTEKGPPSGNQAATAPSQDAPPLRYQVFISYSHSHDSAFAMAVQRGLETFTKPWNRMRAMRVFRDDVSLSANPDLWGSIEQSLAESEWLVLFASPESAASPWVEREVGWWLAHRSLSRLLIVVTSGEFRTDDETGRFLAEGSSAVPAVLKTALSGVPRWVDARWATGMVKIPAEHEDDLRTVVADLASAVYDKPKDELYGAAAREYRRTRILTRTVIAVLSALLVLVLVAAGVAVIQRNHAVDQARISLARQLAAVSASELNTNLDIANLLAVRAFRNEPNPQTRAALLNAIESDPHLVRYLPFSAYVSTLEASGDGRVIIAGLQDGRLMRWFVDAPAPELLATLPGEITSLSANNDGSVVTAVGGPAAVVWQAHGRLLRIEPDAGLVPDLVALTPSGSSALVMRSKTRFDGPTRITVYQLPDGQIRLSNNNPHPELSAIPKIMIAGSEEQVFLLEGEYGSWEQRRLSDWSLVTKSNVNFGAHTMAMGAARDGASFTSTNGDPTVSVWRATGPTDTDHPAATAQFTRFSLPRSLTLSADGRTVAVVDSGVLYAAPVGVPGAPRKAATRVGQVGSVNPDGLRFVGDDDHLASAVGNDVVLWNVRQSRRSGGQRPINLPAGCNSCMGPAVAITPDRSHVAVKNSFGVGIVSSLDNPADLRALALPVADDSGPIWNYDGTQLGIPVSVNTRAHPDDLGPRTQLWPILKSHALVARATDDGRNALIVQGDGQIELIDQRSGEVINNFHDPPDIPGVSQNSRIAAASATAQVAVAKNVHCATCMRTFYGPLVLMDGHTGAVTATIKITDIELVSFADNYLLIQRANGILEVWDGKGTAVQRVIPGDPEFVWPPVGSDTGKLIVRQRSDSSIAVVDIESGTTLITYPAIDADQGAKTGVAFSPDGTRLVTVTDDGNGNIGWLAFRDLSDDVLVRTACKTAGRGLAASEWIRLVGTDVPNDLSCH